jgi:hypothetical protein
VVVALVMLLTGGDSPEPAAPVGLALVAAARRKAAAIAALAAALLLPAVLPGVAAGTGFVCPNTLDGVPLVQETPPTENEAIPNFFFAACDYQFNNPEGDAGDRAIHMEAFWTTVDPTASGGFGGSGAGGCATLHGTPTVVHQTPDPGITTQQYYFNSLDRYAYVWVLSDSENLEAIQDAAEDMLFLVAEPQAALCEGAAATGQPTETGERPPPTEESTSDPDNPELDRATNIEFVMLVFGAGAMGMGGALVLRDRARRKKR